MFVETLTLKIMSYDLVLDKIIESVVEGLDVFDPDGDEVVVADWRGYKYIDSDGYLEDAGWPTTISELERFRIVGTDQEVKPSSYTADQIREALPKNLNFAELAIASAVIEEVIANLEKH